MTSLFKISEQHAQALAIIEQMFDDGCSDDEINEALGLLDAIEDSFNAKAINIAMYIRNLDAEATAINEAKKDMDKREKALKAKKERLTNYLLNQMLITETKQIKCPHFVISLRDNPFSVKVGANAVLPDALLLPAKPREPDKRAIKDLLEKGQLIDGCSLERGQSLVIK